MFSIAFLAVVALLLFMWVRWAQRQKRIEVLLQDTISKLENDVYHILETSERLIELTSRYKNAYGPPPPMDNYKEDDLPF